jgi:hypothetical protein
MSALLAVAPRPGQARPLRAFDFGGAKRGAENGGESGRSRADRSAYGALTTRTRRSWSLPKRALCWPKPMSVAMEPGNGADLGVHPSAESGSLEVDEHPRRAGAAGRRDWRYLMGRSVDYWTRRVQGLWCPTRLCRSTTARPIRAASGPASACTLHGGSSRSVGAKVHSPAPTYIIIVHTDTGVGELGRRVAWALGRWDAGGRWGTLGTLGTLGR